MPSPVRYDVEVVLWGRWQAGLVWIYQRDADPQTGVFPITNRAITPSTTGNPLYNDPIAYGLSIVKLPPANPALVVDSDLMNVGKFWVTFTDLSEYRLIQNLIGSSTDVTESDFGRSASYNQLADRWQKRTDQLLAQYKSLLAVYRPLSTGTIKIPTIQPFGTEM